MKSHSFTTSSPETRAAVSIEELCELDVASVCAPNAILFLHLPSRIAVSGLDVVKEWDFTYRTCLAWPASAPNDSCIDGAHFSEVKELLYIATRGENPPPIIDDILSGIYEPLASPKASRVALRKYMELCHHELKKAELLPRERREGWDALGVKAGDKPNNRRST